MNTLRFRNVRRALTGVAGLVAVLAFTAACGGSNDSTSGGGGGDQVATSTSAGLGPILVDADGMTLYFADEETAGSIKCTGECLGFWTPLTVSGSAAPQASGDLTQTLGTVARDDGKTQVTYNGHPLYTFKLDESAGQTQGNDFTDDFDGTTFTWHAITADGQPAAADSRPSPSETSGRYGY